MQGKHPRWIGLLFVLAAIPIFFAAPAPGVPGWVIAAGGMLFAFAGLSITFSSYGRAGLGKWLGLAALLAFLAVFNYAAFGFDAGACSGNFRILGFAKGRDADDCQILFQVGAVVMNGLAALIVWNNFLRRKRPDAS